jgi:RNA polymerase sigma factor (sigma-70 family)
MTNELIIANLDLANKIASAKKKSLPKCISFDEVQSAAFMGLTMAANRYSPKVGGFVPYAAFRIAGEIKDYLRTLCWNGRGKAAKVNSMDDSYDYAAEPESDFEEFFDWITKELSPLGKRILRMYYAEDMTLKDVASQIGLSVTRVYQILQTSLQSLRNHPGFSDDLDQATN